MISSLMRGGTVLAATGSYNHLHIICSDPHFYPQIGGEGVLVVNISSVKPDIPYDSTVVLHCGEHPFIQHDSYVLYAQAVVWKTETIKRRIESGEIIPKTSLKEPYITDVIKGFYRSPYVTRKILKFCKAHCTPSPESSKTT